jgi:integrase/recombinase XerC/integrase/recombinase XerD
MGTVHTLRADRRVMTVEAAKDAYLATLDHAERRKTHHVYGQWLGALTRALGPDTAIGDITADTLSSAFRECWGEVKPATWNSRRGAVGAWLGYCKGQGWVPSADTLMAAVESRKLAPDRTRALSKADVERLLTSDKHSLRDRTLWRMLYETAARSAEVLALNVEDLDRANKRARVRRKGGAQDVIVWQTKTARLLSDMLGKRETGPVFVTDRKGKGWAKGHIHSADLDPDGHARLSYRQAEDDFKAATEATLGRAATVHQLRHSALTHDAERGTSTSMLMGRSGHTSVRSLAKYARVSAEAIQRHQEATDPARRP